MRHRRLLSKGAGSFTSRPARCQGSHPGSASIATSISGADTSRLTRRVGRPTLNHMVKYQGNALDATFAALADPTRRAILARLAGREASVSELARPFAISLPGVHKHLRVLERAGLVAHAKHGRVRRCRLVARPMQEAGRWVEAYRRDPEAQFGALAAYIDQPEPQETAPWPPETGRPPSPPSPSGSAAPSRRRGSGSSGRGRSRKRSEEHTSEL